MLGLTKRQKQVLDFIKDYITDSGGVGPSYQEIADGVGLTSKSSVHRVVHALIDRHALNAPASAGWYMKARTLAPSNATDPVVGVVGELCRRSAESGLAVSEDAIRAALARAA